MTSRRTGNRSIKKKTLASILVQLRDRAIQDPSVFKTSEDWFYWMGAGQPVPIPAHLLKSTPVAQPSSTPVSKGETSSESATPPTPAATSAATPAPTPAVTLDTSSTPISKGETSSESATPPTIHFLTSMARTLGKQCTVNPRTAIPSKASFVVFDTETTGTSGHDLVVQLAYEIYDSDGQPLKTYNQLVRLPRGRKIPKKATEIHRITTQDTIDRGLYAGDVVQDFIEVITNARKARIKVVAHNASFDKRLMLQSGRISGVAQQALDQLAAYPFFCTMVSSTPYFRRPDGRNRRPRNSELYEHLKGSPPDANLHDAIEDVRVTAQSYLMGRRRGWWS